MIFTSMDKGSTFYFSDKDIYFAPKFEKFAQYFRAVLKTCTAKQIRMVNYFLQDF